MQRRKVLNTHKKQVTLLSVRLTHYLESNTKNKRHECSTFFCLESFINQSNIEKDIFLGFIYGMNCIVAYRGIWQKNFFYYCMQIFSSSYINNRWIDSKQKNFLSWKLRLLCFRFQILNVEIHYYQCYSP